MKAIVLSAGQGRRLLPLTADLPKCLLPIDGETTVLSRQLEELAACGVDRVAVVVGFGAERVEQHLAKHPVPGVSIELLYNPFYGRSDNLATCWLSRGAMEDDFLLLNGDTLFERDLLKRVLAAPSAPITVTVDHKANYDDDDMKVSLDASGRVLAIGKTLPLASVGAESIGMIAFREQGAKLFVGGLDEAIRGEEAMSRWYLSVIHDLAQDHPVETCSIRGHWWQEIDSKEDLDAARAAYRERGSSSANTR